MAHNLTLNFCPQCGTPLQDKEAYGRTRRYCSECDIIVFREHKVAAALLAQDTEGRVLLVRRAWDPKRGLWSLPAGFVDVGETPAEAAVRECYEETGLVTKVTALLDVVPGREHARGADIVIIYRGHVLEGLLKASDDATEAAYFALDALPPLAFQATQYALDKLK